MTRSRRLGRAGYRMRGYARTNIGNLLAADNGSLVRLSQTRRRRLRGNEEDMKDRVLRLSVHEQQQQ